MVKYKNYIEIYKKNYILLKKPLAIIEHIQFNRKHIKYLYIFVSLAVYIMQMILSKGHQTFYLEMCKVLHTYIKILS